MLNFVFLGMVCLVGKTGSRFVQRSERSTGKISMFTVSCFPRYSISTNWTTNLNIVCPVGSHAVSPGCDSYLCAVQAAHCSTSDPRWESHTQDQEMSQIVVHDPAAVFQDCHPGADTLRRQCAGHVGHCADNGRGFQSSLVHVSPDFVSWADCVFVHLFTFLWFGSGPRKWFKSTWLLFNILKHLTNQNILQSKHLTVDWTSFRELQKFKDLNIGKDVLKILKIFSTEDVLKV